jgi:LPS export ABC transporter permease LptF
MSSRKAESHPLRIVTRYVLREFFIYFTLALVATSSILILRQIFLLTKRFVSKDVSLLYLGELVAYALPSVLSLTIPMAVLAGMLMVLGQFAFTGEITALRASGYGVHRLVVPVSVVGLLFALVDYGMMDYALPWGNRRYIELYFELSRKSPALILEEGVVMRNMESSERLWFVENVDPKTKRLHGVRIWESYKDGRPRLTIAKEASLQVLKGESILTLFDGISYEHGNRDDDVLQIRFPRQEIVLNIGDQLGRSDSRFKVYRAMDSLALRDEIRSLRKDRDTMPSGASQRSLDVSLRRARIELHKKYAIPFACFAFALVSVPFGVMTRRSGFMVGMAIGLPLIIVYYTLQRVGETLGERGMLDEVIGVWVPNLPIVLLGVAMTIRMFRK